MKVFYKFKITLSASSRPEGWVRVCTSKESSYIMSASSNYKRKFNARKLGETK